MKDLVLTRYVDATYRFKHETVYVCFAKASGNWLCNRIKCYWTLNDISVEHEVWHMLDINQVHFTEL